MTNDIEKGSIGSSFDDYLEQEGIREEVQEIAVKRVVAFQIAEAMKEQGMTKVEMAQRLETSRSQLDRLLDPENDKVTLGVLSKAANAVGRKLRLTLL